MDITFQDCIRCQGKGGRGDMDKRRESEEDIILAENLVNIYLDKNGLHIQTFSSLKSKIASHSILPAVKRDSK